MFCFIHHGVSKYPDVGSEDTTPLADAFPPIQHPFWIRNTYCLLEDNETVTISFYDSTTDPVLAIILVTWAGKNLLGSQNNTDSESVAKQGNDESKVRNEDVDSVRRRSSLVSCF